MKAINAAFYGRYSSAAQNDASIEQQLADCEAFCARSGLKVVAQYADRARTGTNDARPEFLRMVEDSAKHIFEVIIVWKLDPGEPASAAPDPKRGRRFVP